MRSVERRYYSFLQDSARWDGFAFRDGDIVISTPPKCGTTWMQMITALLVFQTPVFEQPLSVISPWLDMLTSDLPSIVAALSAQQHRRFIKTHTPLDGLPFVERVQYLCVGRDPREVGVSWGDHMANINFETLVNVRVEAVGIDDLPDVMGDGPPQIPEDPVDRFWWWVDDQTPPEATISTLRATLHHLDTFWQARDLPNVELFHYSDLTSDLRGEMERLAAWLGIDVPDDRWSALVEAAGFERMRDRAAELVPNSTHGFWQDTTAFFRSGTTGRWSSILDPDDMQRYDARVALLAAPDLAAWAEHGRHRAA